MSLEVVSILEEGKVEVEKQDVFEVISLDLNRRINDLLTLKEVEAIYEFFGFCDTDLSKNFNKENLNPVLVRAFQKLRPLKNDPLMVEAMDFFNNN